MKIQLFSNPYFIAEFEDEKQMALVTALSEIGKLTLGAYQEQLVIMLQSFSKLARVEAVLIDSSESTFPITPAIQAKIAQLYGETFLPKGAKKCAMILPKEIISNISYEQTVDEAKGLGYEKYIQLQNFDTYAEAWQWINE
jgi:hypothetical protein